MWGLNLTLAKAEDNMVQRRHRAIDVLQTPVRICGTMDLGSPPATQFQPPGNAIIHANVHSIEREPEVGVSQSSSFHDEVAKQLSPEEIEEQKRASDMQLWWDEAISRNMNIPDGYRDVAVLIIKWDDDIDQLKCAPEVSTFKQSRAVEDFC